MMARRANNLPAQGNALGWENATHLALKEQNLKITP